jgi:hypothetical protein
MTAEMSPLMLIMLVLGISVFVFIMLLPALLELKRPRDAGPRRILEGTHGFLPYSQILMLEKAEERISTDLGIMRKITEIISFLPNLEA